MNTKAVYDPDHSNYSQRLPLQPMIEIKLTKTTITEPLINDILEILELIFGSHSYDYESLKWRFEKMPDVSLFLALSNNKIVGFKAGYALSHKLYYSWLGGVLPEWRGQGIAGLLMKKQHEWITKSQYKIIETHTEQKNQTMVKLNINSGLKPIGEFLNLDQTYWIMQKELSEDE